MSELLTSAFNVALLALPFAFVAALARELARERGSNALGWRLFAAGCLALLVGLAWGFWQSKTLAGRQMWTAATFALAWIVPRTVLIVLVCWGVRGRLAARKDR